MPETPNFPPYWTDEQDWLCVIEFLPSDEESERARGASVVGYLSAYAQMTNTRMLALLGGPVGEAYELLFSFSSEEDKAEFLRLMQSNEATQTETELIVVPSSDEIRDAKPIGLVLPEDVLRHATAVAIMVMSGKGSERLN